MKKVKTHCKVHRLKVQAQLRLLLKRNWLNSLIQLPLSVEMITLRLQAAKEHRVLTVMEQQVEEVC